jgi:hypothetical protein
VSDISLEDLERQIKALVDHYNERHRRETGCACRTILAGMTAHGCPQHDRHDDEDDGPEIEHPEHVCDEWCQTCEESRFDG